MSLRSPLVAAVAASVLSFSPSSVLGQVTLVRQGASPDTVAVAASAYRAGFTITNRAADSATYYIGCVGLGAAACVTAARDSIPLAPGQQVTMQVDYRATRAGRGLVVFRVRDARSGARASAALLLSVTGS